jgi:hypothetical protein
MSQVTISPAYLEKGEDAFQKNEGRDSMYHVASFLLEQWWGQFAEMADALAVLLLTWNQAFYRYESFRAEQLEAFLKDDTNWRLIEEFRGRNIKTLTGADEPRIEGLFQGLLNAICTSRGRTPVGVAKALHLLAPNFFPIWDKTIAIEYGCRYESNPARAYINFCALMRGLVAQLDGQIEPSSKSTLKRIDEFNYAKFTKGWVDCD